MRARVVCALFLTLACSAPAEDSLKPVPKGGGLAPPPPAAPMMTISGDCSGGAPLTFQLSDLSASGDFAVLASRSTGATPIPASAVSCVGTELGLDEPLFVLERWTATPAGTDIFQRTPSADICDWYATAVDLDTCGVSDVVSLEGGSGADLDPSDGVITALPAGHVGASFFDRYTTAFGVPIFAAPGVGDDDVTYVATIMKEYLDNDEDGAADDADVLASMLDMRAAMVIFRTWDEAHDLWGSSFEMSYVWQPNPVELIHPGSPTGRFDGTLEEVLHLIHTTGYAPTWPSAFGTFGATDLTGAMDLARGGHFVSVPASYPADAWYHYFDPTCGYECQAAEYFYWGLTSQLGAQQAAWRCSEIAGEWEPCTPALFESTDVALHALVTDPSYGLPTVLPDGSYTP